MDPDSSSTRKVRFAPKGPPLRKRRENFVKTKTEADGDEESDDNEAAEAILRRASERLTRRRSKTEKKAVEVAFSHGRASSTSIRTFGKPRENTVNRDSTELKDRESDDGEDLDSLPPLPSRIGADLAESLANATNDLFKKKKKEYKEPWDYQSDYPITLPLRRPNAGDPEILDEAEFGEAAANVKYDENTIHPASELGLLEEVDEARIMFLQLPAILPFCKRPASTEGRDAADCLTLPGNRSPMNKGKEAAGSDPRLLASAKGKEIVGSSTISRRQFSSTKGCSLEELPEGHIGKMLVYKSGAIKLKLGDVLYDVSPGSGCTFPQDVVAINTVEKQCCQLGKVTNRAVVTPDVDFLLNNSL